jgi:WD40 repeat protein
LSVSFSPDGKQVASGSHDNSVKIWETSTGTCVSTLSGHSRPVTSVAWNNDGSNLATGSWDESVKVWSVSSADTFECQSTLSGHWGPVASVAWNNDSSKLATGSWDKTVRIWAVGSAGTFKCQSKLAVDHYVSSVAFSPDGSKIAAAHSKKISIFDAQTQAKLGSPLNGHSNCINSVTWNNDGTKLASGSLDDTVRIWSVGSAGTFESESTLRGDQRINCVAFSGKI